MEPIRILIIDDEADVCTFFRRLLTKKGHLVCTAGNEEEAVRALEESFFHVALVDLKLPDTDGISLLKRIKSRQPACEVIIMTGYSTVKTAVSAMQMGAFEYLEKPFDDIDEIETLIEKAGTCCINLQQGYRSRDDWADLAEGVGFRVGQSPEMRRLTSLAYKIASKNINVLIQGKTGTGKEVLARFIHAASGRADQPFIPVNCGALPENLLESELFGHQKGAFTGANQTRRGIFELANRGTLFLDEIGDASPQIQVKLLRALETGEFMRVGGETTLKADVRVIAATNVDLEQAIRERIFREDLYYRLNVVRLELPPLNMRSEDVPMLAEHFIKHLNPALRLSPSAIMLLREYRWPGNIRELSNVIRRAAVLCNGETIMPQHLGQKIYQPPPSPAERPPAPPQEATDSPPPPSAPLLGSYPTEASLEALSSEELKRLQEELQALEARLGRVMKRRGMESRESTNLKTVEAEMIRQALEANHWNITETAKTLGIARNTLHRKINALNLRHR